jgi:hypothetical protein
VYSGTVASLNFTRPQVNLVIIFVFLSVALNEFCRLTLTRLSSASM